MKYSITTFISLLICLNLVNCSTGDRALEFQECLTSCVYGLCAKQEADLDIPWYRSILLWDCFQDCDYTCQQVVTEERVQQGLPILQYHGKWPFVRLGGIQEPASVLFSILNFLPNYYGFKKISASILYTDAPGANVYLRKYYMLFAMAQMNAWFWSSVFHTRDFVLTERLDYFSAMLTILVGLFTACVRVWRLDTPQKFKQRLVVIAACVMFYLCHVGYLSLVKFSYSYNMTAGVIVGFLQNSVWTYLSICMYQKDSEHTWTLWPICITLWLTVSMALELFDFPPIFYMLDAHSLWHLATVIPYFWWYKWMDQDIMFLKREKFKMESRGKY